MIDDIKSLLDNYHKWLKDNTHSRQVDGWVEVTTPYLDRHNDCLQIYVKQEGGGYLLMDDGYIIEDLESSGCKLDSPKRQQLLHTVLNGYGVKLVDGNLQVHATNDSFSIRKHNLLQAMISVNDMFYMSRASVNSLFCEDVTSWLDMHDIRYTPNVKFTGISSFDYVFDFVIPKSKLQPERLIKTVTNPNQESAKSLILAWHETREFRDPNSRFYAMLNDTEHDISSRVIDAFDSYGMVVVPWSRREEKLTELAA